MGNTKYTYAVARIRALEVALFSDAVIEQLLSCKTAAEALQFVVEKGWGDMADQDDPDVVLRREEEKTWEVIKEVAPDASVFNVLSYPKLYHNLKAAIKEVCTEARNPNIFYDDCPIPGEEMLRIVENREFSRLPSHMGNVAQEALETLLHTRDGQLCDIMIDKAALEAIRKAGKESGEPIIENYADILGKTLYVSGREYVITGIIDTKFNFDRYKVLMEKKENQSTADTLVEYALMNEFSYAASYSLAGAAFTGEGKVDELLKEDPDIAPLRDIFVSYYSSNYTLDSMYAAKLENVKNLDIIWLDGEKTGLAENELVVSEDAIMANGMESGDFTDEEVLAKLKMENFTITAYERNGGGDITTQKGYKIVGIIPTEKQEQYSSTIAMSDSEYAKYIHMDKGAYSYMVGAMPEKESEIRDLVAYCYKEDGDVQYQLQNAVTYELDTIHSVLKVLSKIFLYVGIGFAAFASIMLANFIGTSIAHKKQEIGILRAIGSRSNDVFRIFFSESFVIAMINFVLASVGVGVVTTIINVTIRNRLNVLVTVLNFGIRQVALLFVVSIVVAALASFLPVKKIASKRPIDAIRNR